MSPAGRPRINLADYEYEIRSWVAERATHDEIRARIHEETGVLVSDKTFQGD